MPRRSPPPKRSEAEDALLPHELSALKSSTAALGVALDRWTQVPALAAFWGTVATVRIAEQRRKEFPNLSEDRALAIAAERLDLCGETVRTRLRRFFRHAYGL